MEFGKVKVFFVNGYGFVRTDEGEEIFFHITEGRELEEGDEEPEFSERRVRDPKEGEHLVFQVSTGFSKGKQKPKACPWGYTQEYDRIQGQIANRPNYRVMQQYQIPGSGPMEPTVLWQGTNLKELCRKYPRLEDIRMDDLFSGFSCGDFDKFVWFERSVGEVWSLCEDPRPYERKSSRW